MDTIYDSRRCFCFCCEEEIDSAARDSSAWEMPSCGVILEGGGNYGSTVYDSMMDGIFIRLVICDNCLKEKRGFLREVRKNYQEQRNNND